MIQALLGQKQLQTQRFLSDGTRIPVTVVSMAANPVMAIKTKDKHGYVAVQLGFGTKKKPRKSEANYARGANVSYTPRFLREVRVHDEAAELPNVGDAVSATDVFKPGDIVDVSGTSKGKGYAGVVKRYHFRGGPKTHGQSDRERAPGSIGQTTTPGRVYKGKKMAGHMGDDNVTVKNLTVVDVQNDSILIKGLLPGVIKSIVFVTKTGEEKKFIPLQTLPQEEIKKENDEATVVAEEGKGDVQEGEKNV